MSKKRKLILALAFSALLACKKDKAGDPAPAESAPTPAPYVNPYPRPWKTEFISYKNVTAPDCGSSHAAGYKIFYKDTLLQSFCWSFDEARHLGKALTVNDSTMLIYRSYVHGGSVLYTRSGGYKWV